MCSENNLNHFDAEVKRLLEGVAKDQKLFNYTIKKAGGTMKGDGYLGVITAVEISGLCDGEKKLLELVVKTASKSDALRVDTPIADVFQREIYMYRTIIPAFHKFQKESELEVLSSFAKCYEATIIDKSEALVLQNLKSVGFKLWERRIPMNEEHVELVMAEYGRFHAISFALRDQEPETYRKLTEPMDDVLVKFFQSEIMRLFCNQCRKVADLLDAVKDARAYMIANAFADDAEQFVKDLSQLVDCYSVVLHGDCWTNNMMFGYDDPKKPESPTRVSLIDLQLSRIGPPVLDISYFFYTCSSKDIITNFQHYLDIYYSNLADYLRKLGSDPEKLYPYSVFRRQWKESARFGLFMSLFIIKLMLSEQDEVADLADVADSGKSVADAFDYDIAKSDEYNDRVKHIILHFVNNKFI